MNFIFCIIFTSVVLNICMRLSSRFFVWGGKLRLHVRIKTSGERLPSLDRIYPDEVVQVPLPIHSALTTERVWAHWTDPVMSLHIKLTISVAAPWTHRPTQTQRKSSPHTLERMCSMLRQPCDKVCPSMVIILWCDCWDIMTLGISHTILVPC